MKTPLSDKMLLSGNEAVARGAWEVGVGVGCGYPGTPSTEILEVLSQHSEVCCEWSVNEKVALEVALGASLQGARALVTMKHVGVNVAADPLFTAAYTGVKGGLVIVTADEPSMYSSQNEQDNRNYAMAAKVPMLEPSDAEEARVFTKFAFSLSEQFDMPVFVRTTTRLSHSKSIVSLAKRETRQVSGFERNTGKYVMIPANARVRRQHLEQRLAALEAASSTHPANRIEPGNPGVGVITSGIPYTYVKEALPDASVLKIGLVHPMPKDLVETFARTVKTLYVVEELDPIMETQVKSWGIPCIGKKILPTMGELSPDILRRAVSEGSLKPVRVTALSIPERKPTLCPGCPHRHVFSALKDKNMIICGDIGCYTLGVFPPFELIDTCVDMGASIPMAQGVSMTQSGRTSAPRIAAVIGDSTFAHSGLTGLLNACWNQRDGLFIVLDNAATAMTGMQPNPLSGEVMGRRDAPSLDYAHLARAFNIPDKGFMLVDAYDKAAVSRAVDLLAEQSGVRLLVVLGLCMVEMKKLKKLGKLDRKRAARQALLSAAAKDGSKGGVDV